MEEEEYEENIIKITNEFWPRWTENSINEIQWGSQQEKTKKKSPKNKPQKSETGQDAQPNKFTDIEVCILPKKYQESIYYWKRPKEIFENSTSEDLVLDHKIEIFTNNLVDLHEVNSHLKFSSYYLNIIDAFEALNLCKTWVTEDFGEFGFNKWSPLNHIYSGSKVKLGVPHEVKVNENGKYAIRLFHCGAWRQIIVDDRIPTDKKNQILIPCIRTETSLDLWPLLLSKAILKLNFCRMEDEEFYIDQRHTPECKMYDGDYCNCKEFIPIKTEYIHKEKDLQRMNVIYALTGWYPFEINLGRKYESDVWENFIAILDHYKVPEKPADDKSKKKGAKGGKEKGTKAGKKDKQKDSLPEKAVEIAEVVPAIYPLVTIDMLLPPNSAEHNYKRYFMDLLCTQYRDTPLFQIIKPEDVQLWKTFRWVYWAMEKQIWKPYDPSQFFSLLCSFPLSKKGNFENVLEEEWASMVLKKDENKIVEDIILNEEKPVKGKKDKKDKKKVKEKKTEKKEEPFPNENWIDFNKILPFLQCIREFYKNYSFQKNFIMSDEKVEIENIPTTSKKKKDTPKSAKQKKSETKIEDLMEEKLNFHVDKCAELYLFIDHENIDECIVDLSVMKLCPPEESAVCLLSFRWYCSKQKQLWVLLTSNFNGLKTHFPKGRSIYKLQFDAYKFCLRINTNAPLRIGNFNELLDMMNSESVRLTKYFENIKDTFLEVINSVGQKIFRERLQNLFHSLLEYSDEFYRTIVPFRHYIYYKFIETVLNFLTVLGDSDDVSTVRRLFLLADFSQSYDPNLVLHKNCLKIMKDYNEIKDCLCDCPDTEPYFTEEALNAIKTCAAVIIQAAFKRYYVQLLKRYHFGTKQKPEEKPNILKADLKKFYEKYFLKEPNLMYDLLRKFFYSSFEDFKYNHTLEAPIPEDRLIGKFYEFFKDFKNCLHVLKYQGIVEQGSNWIPLKIGCFYCHSNIASKYILHTTSESEQKVEVFTKVIKCDDLTEVLPNEVSYLYTLSKEDRSGYKVAIYMYANEPLVNCKWTLQVAFPRHESYSHFCDLCGTDKCHCPNDIKVNKSFDNYVLRCESTDIEDFVVYQNEDTLLESSDKLVCQHQLYTEKPSLIFGFLKYSGEPVELTVNLTKQGQIRPLIRRKFTDRIDFWVHIDSGSFTLTVTYEYKGRSSLNKLLESMRKPSPLNATSEDSKDVDDLILNEEETMMEEYEEVPKELGLWNIKIAYEQGFDVTIN